jgi:hypothetical protein
MQELLVDFITSLDGYGPRRAGPAGCTPLTERALLSEPRDVRSINVS